MRKFALKIILIIRIVAKEKTVMKRMDNDSDFSGERLGIGGDVERDW